MKKTLVNKIIIPAVLGVGGCTMTPEGRRFSRDMFGHYINERISREVWSPRQEETNTQTNQSIPNNVYIKNNGEYFPAPGYTWVNPNNNKDLSVMPNNVVWNGKEYNPAPGYTWVNPNNNKDLSVRKIK